MFWAGFFLAVLFMLALMWLLDMLAPLKAQVLRWLDARIRVVVALQWPHLFTESREPKPPSSSRIEELEATLKWISICSGGSGHTSEDMTEIRRKCRSVLEGLEIVGGA